jgi:phosphoglycerate dehydrogenase-like enzyme
VSRGGLINPTALLHALDAGRPRLAALDVLSREPPAAADPLLAHPAVLFSNHIAWYSTRTILRLRSTLAARCAAALVEPGAADPDQLDPPA